MRISTRLIGSIAAAAVLGTLALPALAESTHHVYGIAAQNGSGEYGTVTLTAVGDKTRVDLALTGAAADTPQPAHIHDGSCAKLNPKPKYPLTVAVDGLSTTLVPVPMKDLMAGGLAVNVHRSTTDIPTYVACGDLATK
ncbi:MAG: hypothetical protein NVSMB5_12430 [Candidatus Velthaea sp.]